TITPDTLYAGKSDIEILLNTGSENGTHWIPSEVDVSIRPGWFYHAEEDAQVKSPEELFKIYLTSVGRGSTLLLNIPPDRRGLFHENDVKSLEGFKKLLDAKFKNNLALNATVKVSSFRGKDAAYNGAKLIDGKKATYWATNDGVNNGDITLTFKQKQVVKYITLQENIRLGQRVKAFALDTWANGKWKEIASGTTIGYKRILQLNSVETAKIRVRIMDSKACPVLSEVAVY
ncbi:MAG: hypothetical protein JWQ25_322, partial [Daejeonella sp.]|nr:hypothetical protein [Daejeonella sp.]